VNFEGIRPLQNLFLSPIGADWSDETAELWSHFRSIIVKCHHDWLPSGHECLSLAKISVACEFEAAFGRLAVPVGLIRMQV